MMWFFKIFFITYSTILLIGSTPILGGQPEDDCENLLKNVPSLILELSNPDPEVRERAATSLAKIPDPKTIAPQLISLIDAPNTPNEAREAALFSLRLILWKLPILDPDNQETLEHITDCLRRHEKPEELAPAIDEGEGEGEGEIIEVNPTSRGDFNVKISPFNLNETASPSPPAADVPDNPTPPNEEDYIFQFITPPGSATTPPSVTDLITAALSKSFPIPMREAAYFVLHFIKEVRGHLLTPSELKQIDVVIKVYDELDVVGLTGAKGHYFRVLNSKHPLALRKEELRQLASFSFLYAREIFLDLYTFIIRNAPYYSDDQAMVESIQDVLERKKRTLPPFQRFIAKEILANTPPSTIMEMLYTDFSRNLQRPISAWERIMILISMREIPGSLMNEDFLNLITEIYQNDHDEEVRSTARFMLRIISEEKSGIQLSDGMTETIRNILYPRPSGAKGQQL